MTNSNQSGFSIVELMVSILVLALISVAASSALAVGKRIWEKVQTSPSVPLVDAEMGVLRHIISSRVSIGSSEGGGVSGSEKMLEYKGLAKSDDGVHVLGKIKLVAGKEGLSIEPEGDAQSRILPRLIVEEISYYGRKGGEEIDGWHKEWHPRDPSPELIRFKFADTDQNEAYQLEFSFDN